MARNYEFLQTLTTLEDDVWVDIHEVAAMTGLASATIQQRRIEGLPRPATGIRKLRWRLGDIRAWLRAASATTRSQSALRAPLRHKRKPTTRA